MESRPWPGPSRPLVPARWRRMLLASTRTQSRNSGLRAWALSSADQSRSRTSGRALEPSSSPRNLGMNDGKKNVRSSARLCSVLKVLCLPLSSGRAGLGQTRASSSGRPHLASLIMQTTALSTTPFLRYSVTASLRWPLTSAASALDSSRLRNRNGWASAVASGLADARHSFVPYIHVRGRERSQRHQGKHPAVGTETSCPPPSTRCPRSVWRGQGPRGTDRARPLETPRRGTCRPPAF